MFRSKRYTLVKRLWRNRVLYDEINREAESETTDELETKSVTLSLLKRLREKQLDILIQSVESKGGEMTECVPVPRAEVKLGHRTFSPHILCCKLWRWKDLHAGMGMKKLPFCNIANDSEYVCCNPYHWSLLLETDHTSIKANKQSPEEILLAKDNEPHTYGETETGLTPLTRQQFLSDDPVRGGVNRWCTIAYWELRQRVGRLFPVVTPTFSVFQTLPHGDGMCLEILQHDSDFETVHKTREKIGFGIILSREGGSVWAYNRSKHPIFVNSPMLDKPDSLTFVVRKLPPGYSLCIFDYSECSLLEQQTREHQLTDGPFDPCCVRISFAKGWGPCYSRQFITSCPCWLEILLNDTS